MQCAYVYVTKIKELLIPFQDPPSFLDKDLVTALLGQQILISAHTILVHLPIILNSDVDPVGSVFIWIGG